VASNRIAVRRSEDKEAVQAARGQMRQGGLGAAGAWRLALRESLESFYEGAPMEQRPNLRIRFWWYAASSAAALILLIITLISREWIELLTGWDPDHGSGALEWTIGTALALVAIILGLTAGVEWRRPRPANAKA
jgi:hypothetical protein